MPGYKVIVSELRQPLIRTGVIVCCVLVLSLAGTFYKSSIDAQRITAEQNLEQIERNYRNAIRSEEILRTEAVRFETLRAGGFVGPEPRLRWIQDVRESATASGIVKVEYTLEPRLLPPPQAATGSYSLYTSNMKLELELRHEGDLFAFLSKLEAQRSGLFDVTACSFEPANSEDPVNLLEANVKAACKLQWFTLDLPEPVSNGEPS